MQSTHNALLPGRGRLPLPQPHRLCVQQSHAEAVAVPYRGQVRHLRPVALCRRSATDRAASSFTFAAARSRDRSGTAGVTRGSSTRAAQPPSPPIADVGNKGCTKQWTRVHSSGEGGACDQQRPAARGHWQLQVATEQCRQPGQLLHAGRHAHLAAAGRNPVSVRRHSEHCSVGRGGTEQR